MQTSNCFSLTKYPVGNKRKQENSSHHFASSTMTIRVDFPLQKRRSVSSASLIKTRSSTRNLCNLLDQRLQKLGQSVDCSILWQDKTLVAIFFGIFVSSLLLDAPGFVVVVVRGWRLSKFAKPRYRFSVLDATRRLLVPTQADNFCVDGDLVCARHPLLFEISKKTGRVQISLVFVVGESESFFRPRKTERGFFKNNICTSDSLNRASIGLSARLVARFLAPRGPVRTPRRKPPDCRITWDYVITTISHDQKQIQKQIPGSIEPIMRWERKSILVLEEV
jgi:hypothetical protein